MEILSPASNMEHIKIAIDNKANAVYGGLKKWNARNKAINFTSEEYNTLIKELHENNIKFFLTLNILMLDEEIEEVIHFLKNNTLPDSFIVTDIGLIQRLKQEFPNVPLHFSTQFGCHNIDDVNYVKSLNGTRAILARELTLNEINNIKASTDIELECFIWGSQCLSFSGLCFFGTLINGGGGNRGKCIITCRDIYSINNNFGHYLYVPDMDCINLVSKLKNIDCLKIEGRRRDPKEIALILNRINKKMKSEKNAGYLYGIDIKNNNLFEKINTRTKPFMPANMIKNISNNDICIEYKDDIPIKFSRDYNNPKVMYIYTEIKKDYDLNKKNINMEISFEDDKVKEILYVNHKGDGHTFYSQSLNCISLNFNKMIVDIENNNKHINIYKIKYRKNLDDIYYIDESLYNQLVNYIIEDCKNDKLVLKNNSFQLKQLYVDTKNEKIIDYYIDDSFVKIIYEITAIADLKNIDSIINKYDDKIIYKLPLFNWNSEDLMPYLKLLENKEVMFTRLSQIYLCRNLNFKKRYTDYTIYVWNRNALDYLKENGIDEFTASPELSYERNKTIFKDNMMQVILCGKPPLVYSRNCFGHLFGCSNCSNGKTKEKNIKNVDKNIDLKIICNNDYRCIINKKPILNNYYTVNLNNTTTFRYITLDQSTNDIKNTIKILKTKNYYDNLINLKCWEDSYQCNLYEGKE